MDLTKSYCKTARVSIVVVLVTYIYMGYWPPFRFGVLKIVPQKEMIDDAQGNAILAKMKLCTRYQINQ